MDDTADCDDSRSDVSPAADEYCGGSADEDCDGAVDEDSAVDAPTWYADSDGDDFGDPDAAQIACDQPSGYVEDDTDCDDTNDAINPDEGELADEIDQDCDEVRDENVLEEGDIVISEIHYYSHYGEPEGQWFEVYNTTSNTIYLDGFYVSLGFYVAPEGVALAQGQRMVFCYADDTLGSDCDYIYGSDVNGASSYGDTYNDSAMLEVPALESAGAGYLSLSVLTIQMDHVQYKNGEYYNGWPDVGKYDFAGSIELGNDCWNSGLTSDGAVWCTTDSNIAYGYYSGTYTEYGTPGSSASCTPDGAGYWCTGS